MSFESVLFSQYNKRIVQTVKKKMDTDVNDCE